MILWPDERLPIRAHNFLTSLGIREVPLLDSLIDMIEEDFKSQECKHDPTSYVIPASLRFLAKNVQNYYPELWKEKTNRRVFLPAQWPPHPTTNSYNNYQDASIELVSVHNVYKSWKSFCLLVYLIVFIDVFCHS